MSTFDINQTEKGYEIVLMPVHRGRGPIATSDVNNFSTQFAKNKHCIILASESVAT